MTEKLNLESKWCLGRNMDSTSKRLSVTTIEKMLAKPKTRNFRNYGVKTPKALPSK